MEKEDYRIYTLRDENPVKAVLRLGVPLVAGMFIMALYNLIDTFFVGLLRDDYQLAAVNLAYPIMMVSVAIANMVGTGAASLMARCLGAEDKEKARHTLTAGLELTVFNSVVVGAVGMLFLSPIVHLLGAKSNTTEYTLQYVAVLFVGMLFTMGNYTMGQLLRSEGSVKFSVAGMFVGTVANIVLDPIFIFAFHMEVRGAAIATVIGNALGLLVSVYFYATKKTLLCPGIKYLKPDKDILKEIFWVGIPATLETLLTTVGYVIINNLAVGYGELTVAAMGIAQKIMSFGSYVYQGMASGMQPLMGYNYGAQNYRRMIASLFSGILVVTVFELVIMGVMALFAPMFVAIFTESKEVIQIGSKALRTLMWILPFVGSISMSRVTFQSMGMPQYAFGITVIRQLALYVPLLLILNWIYKFNGLLVAQPITEGIMMVASVMFLVVILKKQGNVKENMV